MVIGQDADIVIDTVAFDATHADQLLEIQADIGSFIVISSSSVYCDDQGRTLDEARLNGFADLPNPVERFDDTAMRPSVLHRTCDLRRGQLRFASSRREAVVFRH